MKTNIAHTTKTDKDKVEFFTRVWSKLHKITPEDNQQYCQRNELAVTNTLKQNADKLTPKWDIDLESIRENDTRNLPIDEHDVKQAIKDTKNKTPGPSQLRKPYFQNLPPNIIRNITHLFNCCYATGLYPKHFKTAEVRLIPKDGPGSDPSNYRPISLLNFMGKIFAKILNNKLIKHLEENNIIRESQHGFRKRKSTNTLIASLYERLAREKAGGRNTLITMILRDIKKAFDRVWHQGLIYKLMQIGIETPLLRILTDFLKARKAYIKLNHEKGETYNLEAGVPQGDVLSPILYLIMCNDYPAPTFNGQNRNFVKQYADDLTQVVITRFNSKIDHQKREIHKNNIIAEINKQNEYEKLWKITTNMNKFQIIHVGSKTVPTITIEGRVIPHTIVAKLLGMQFTIYNFYTKQVKNNKTRAIEEVRKLYRFRYMKRKLKLRLYKTLILPLITQPAVPLNSLSRAQMHELQIAQNEGIRWIFNDRYPVMRPLTVRHEQAKLEYIAERIKRLAEGIWFKLTEENSEFTRETLSIPTPTEHTWFRSSYNRTKVPRNTQHTGEGKTKLRRS